MDRTTILDRTSMDLGLSKGEAAEYSVAKAILCAAGQEKSGLEYEVSQALGTKLGRPGRGNNSIFLPSTLRPQQSGLETSVDSAGGYLVATKIPDLIEALRQQMRCVQLGATFISGLSSNISFATEVNTTSAQWIAEENPGVDVSDQDMSFGSKGVRPHTLQSSTSLSRQLLTQNSVDLEKRIRMDLMKSHAIALDQACINGSGTSGQPVGLLQYAGVPTVSIGTSGGPATYAHICQMEETVAAANADFPGLAFLTTPVQRQKLRQVYKGASGVLPVWGDEGPGPLGYRGEVSNAVPSTLVKGASGAVCHAIIAGNFSEMIIAEFGATEIIVDVYTAKKTGMIQITSFGLVDVLIRQLGAFCVIVDAT